MRVVFTVHKYPPESLGGTEIYSWSLARALVAEGHEVHVFYPLPNLPPLDAHIEQAGVQLWRVPLPAARSAENPVAQWWHTFRDTGIESEFRKLLARVRPDLIHFQHVQGVSAKLIELTSAWPRVVTLHDYWYFCANSQLIRPNRQVCTAGPRGGWNCVECATARIDLTALRAARPLVALPLAYRNAYLRRMLRSIDQFIAPSHFLRDQYIRFGFPADRIGVIENGLDLDRLQTAAGATLPMPPARPHFVFLGSLAWQKGVHVLVEAFNQLPHTVSLTIYGSDTAFPDYARQLKAQVQHPFVRFGGALSPDQVGDALRQADALIVPSIWYENSPVVIQEAYALGVPVIASRIGALIEKVHEGETGRLFTVNDSADLARVVQEISAQPAQLAQFRANLQPPLTVLQHAQEIARLYAVLLHKTANPG